MVNLPTFAQHAAPGWQLGTSFHLNHERGISLISTKKIMVAEAGTEPNRTPSTSEAIPVTSVQMRDAGIGEHTAAIINFSTGTGTKANSAAQRVSEIANAGEERTVISFKGKTTTKISEESVE